MGAIIIYLLIVVSGFLQSAGNSMNAQLKNSLQNPWLASSVSFSLILIVFLLLFAVFHKPLPSMTSLSTLPWWAPLGGLAGSMAFFLALLFVTKIGSGPFNGTVITANIIASLLIDHYGLFNMPIHSINMMRLIGGALMIGGIILISFF